MSEIGAPSSYAYNETDMASDVEDVINLSFNVSRSNNKFIKNEGRVIIEATFSSNAKVAGILTKKYKEHSHIPILEGKRIVFDDIHMELTKSVNLSKRESTRLWTSLINRGWIVDNGNR
jgi:hypothetical protein